MSEGPENFVLIYLRRMDAKLDMVLDGIETLKTRVSILEGGLANVRTEIAGLHHAYAALQVKFDQVDKRLDRIERRLDLRELHA